MISELIDVCDLFDWMDCLKGKSRGNEQFSTTFQK